MTGPAGAPFGKGEGGGRRRRSPGRRRRPIPGPGFIFASQATIGGNGTWGGGGYDFPAYNVLETWTMEFFFHFVSIFTNKYITLCTYLCLHYFFDFSPISMQWRTKFVLFILGIVDQKLKNSKQ